MHGLVTAVNSGDLVYNLALQDSSVWLKRKSGDRHAPVEQLGKLESELMERIWKRSEASVRDLHEELGPRLAYTTVMTTLDRLFKKGLLDRYPLGRAFVYKAKVTKQEYDRHLTAHLLGIAVDEAGSRQAVMSCFVDFVSESDQKLLDDLEKLIKEKRRSLRREEPR